MLITTIMGNKQKLDGGAMFGNAPRELWKKWLAADELNRIELACRCFLIEFADRKILLETGVGAFFAPELKDRFGIQEEGHILLQELARKNVRPEEITDVILSHLHFDHAGGVLSSFQKEKALELVFPHARFFTGKKQWERALAPHFRDKASYIQQLHPLLEKSGRLCLVEEKEGELAESKHPALPDSFSFVFTDGHTPGLMHTIIRGPQHKVAFASDLIPGKPWIHVPITMGYDRFPERLIEEKGGFLKKMEQENILVLFTHDPELSAVRVQLSPEGKWGVKESFLYFSDFAL